MSEFGNLALVEDRDDPQERSAIKLPGARRGDMSARAMKQEVRDTNVCYCASLWRELLLFLRTFLKTLIFLYQMMGFFNPT